MFYVGSGYLSKYAADAPAAAKKPGYWEYGEIGKKGDGSRLFGKKWVPFDDAGTPAAPKDTPKVTVLGNTKDPKTGKLTQEVMDFDTWNKKQPKYPGAMGLAGEEAGSGAAAVAKAPWSLKKKLLVGGGAAAALGLGALGLHKALSD